MSGIPPSESAHRHAYCPRPSVRPLARSRPVASRVLAQSRCPGTRVRVSASTNYRTHGSFVLLHERLV
eukprot:4488240-Prymnesium_polylepis.1